MPGPIDITASFPVRKLLHDSEGTPLAVLARQGLVHEAARALLGDAVSTVSIHHDAAARVAVARCGAHAICLGTRVFLGPTVGTALGPTLGEALHHELVHVAQGFTALRSGRVSPVDVVEDEAQRLSAFPRSGMVVAHGAAPDEIYGLWWLIPIAAAAYVMLRPNVANAPEPGGRTYPSVSEVQVAGEALALFAVPEASFLAAGRLGLGFYGSMAVAGATATTSFRAVGDVSRGTFSGVQAYVVDGATGAVIGVVVPGGIRLIGSSATRSLDWLATQGMRQSDFAITRALSQRSAQTPVTISELASMFERRGLTGRAAEWWLNRRGLIVLYRGQTTPTASILSPMARTSGVDASEALVAQMRAAGLTPEEIAGYTARWHDNPVPSFLAPPGLGNQPLGAAGIPTTRTPGIAANFGEEGIVYVIRLPRDAAIRVPEWGLAVESEYVILNQVPPGSTVQVIRSMEIPALQVDELGRLVPGRRGR